ncbi:MAG: 50S ribosomal protein L18 [Pirellulaceae bacterium]
MNKEKFIQRQRTRRRHHVRKSVRGSGDRPRLTVYRSNAHIYCQLINDETGTTLASASTREAAFRDSAASSGGCEAATAIGKTIAERATAAGITKVCFDRGHTRYNGRIAALATAAREAGLDF